jgi:hypothetical protein
MRHDDDARLSEHDPELSALFAELPRKAASDPRGADRLVARLRLEGFLNRRGWARWPIGIAAALLLLGLGAWGGWTAGRRGSLEEMLARNDLTIGDRVLLLQRAGSAYVTAAQSYANATARTDTAAIEVASRVLLGAAHAVARNHLDAGVAARLTNALQSPSPQPTIWF